MSSKDKPIVFLVEDSNEICEIFRRALPSDWDVRCFESPATALSALSVTKPWVIVSDLKLPVMSGDEFLFLAKQISPNSLRIMQSAFSDERSLLDSIRKAQVIDYIKKPLNIQLIRHRIGLAVDLFRASERSRELSKEASEKDLALIQAREQLDKTIEELEQLKLNVPKETLEIERWAPSAVVWGIKNNRLPAANATRNVALFMMHLQPDTYIPTLKNGDLSLRSLFLNGYSDSVMKYSGVREMIGSGFILAYYGLLNMGENVCDLALASALEFFSAIKNMERKFNVKMGVNMSLDYIPNFTVKYQTHSINTPNGFMAQKSFDMTDLDYRKLLKATKDVESMGLSSFILISNEFKMQLKRRADDQIFFRKAPCEGFFLHSFENPNHFQDSSSNSNGPKT